MTESGENLEKRIYVDALRKAARDYEELVGELSILRRLNDSFKVGLSFLDICRNLLEFVTEALNVENASIMEYDEGKQELRLLVARNFYEGEGAVFEEVGRSRRVFKLGEGIAGQAARDRKSVLIDDARDDPRFVNDRDQKVSIRSMLSLPLVHGDRLHGVLNLSNSEPHAFHKRKEHALNLIASTAALALSHAVAVDKMRRLNESLTNRNKELDIVIALSESLHANLDPDIVLNESLNNVLRGFDIDAVGIFLDEQPSGAMELKAHRTRQIGIPVAPTLTLLNERFGKEIMAKRGPMVYTGLNARKGDSHMPAVCVGVPLFSGDDCFGILMACRSSRPSFEEGEITLLRSICNQISLAIHNSILISRLKENIHELQETRHKLIQADKLALLGEMLSSVAHEINNPLAAIMGYSELLLDHEPLTERTRELLRKVVLCVDRSRKIVQGLLSFARKTELKKSEVNVHEVVDRALEYREHDFTLNGIEVIKEYMNEAPLAILDCNQMEQVFLNLINNAFDSMVGRAEPGVLRIVTRLIDQSTLQVEFTDNGGGIAPKNRARVFEPFFTTKEVGKGTGLGLSVSYGIVKEHEGNLYLDESCEHGARFVVTLPLSKNFALKEESKCDGEPVCANAARVLVVDDEEVVADVISTVLASDGFAVECASDGESAYRMLGSTSYDLVITDIKMPGAMDGKRLFRALRKENPEMAERFIFVTGDIIERETESFLKESGRAFLLKPFSIRDLRELVQKALQQN